MNNKKIPITKNQKEIADKVYREVADKYCVDVKLMRSNRKPEEIVRARFIAWHILSKKYKWANSQIARVVKKDRAVIRYGLKKVAKLKL